jgi:hypothetical protein
MEHAAGAGKRRRSDPNKEWSPFSGTGHKLGESSGETLQSPDERPTNYRRMDNPTEFPEPPASSSKTLESPDEAQMKLIIESRESQMTASPMVLPTFDNGYHNDVTDIIDVDAQPAADLVLEPNQHAEWASIFGKRNHLQEYWQQKDSWTLADLVSEPVRSDVFSTGDLGQQPLPLSWQLLVTYPTMLQVLQNSALALLHQSLALLGLEAPDDLAATADVSLHEGLVTPMQHKYLVFLKGWSDLPYSPPRKTTPFDSTSSSSSSSSSSAASSMTSA